MNTLLDRRKMPPGGWRFRQAETRWQIKDPLVVTFDGAVQQIIGHRSANRALGLSVDPFEVGQELEAFTCARPECAGFCSKPEEVELPAQKKSPVSGVGAVVARLKNDLRGAVTLAKWSLRDGGKPVVRPLALKRASVCNTCEFNQNSTGWERNIAEFIRKEQSTRRQMNLTMVNDHLLKTCTACGCDLKLKVWTPLEHIDTSHEGLEELPPHCWVREEAGPPEAKTIVLRRTAAYGDVIEASVIADRLKEMGFRVLLNTAPAIRDTFTGHPSFDGISDEKPDVDLDRTYEFKTHTKHIQEWFHIAANDQLSALGINLGKFSQRTPVLHLSEREKVKALELMELHPKPWTVIIPWSNSYGNRSVPKEIWSKASEGISGTCFNAGIGGIAAPVVNLRPKTFREVMAIIFWADTVASVDTGPMHVAAVFGKPIVAIEQAFKISLRLPESAQRSIVSAKLDCIGCGKHKCPIDEKNPPCRVIDPLKIAKAVNAYNA